MKFSEAKAFFCEEIKPAPKGKKGCFVFDIDDCIVKADGKMIGIWKEKPGEKPVRLSSDQYAKDKDAAVHKEWFNYKEFRDPEKVYNSIVNGTPILKNLKALDAHARANYTIVFLTARGLKDVVANALKDYLKINDGKGNLSPIGNRLNIELSQAVNDENFIKTYPGLGDPEKKAMVLKQLCKKFDKVKFIDDDKKNVSYAKNLKIPNLQVIQAWT